MLDISPRGPVSPPITSPQGNNIVNHQPLFAPPPPPPLPSTYLGDNIVKACLHRAFAFFCIIQCRKRFYLSLVSMGDANANARCKQALKRRSLFPHISLGEQYSKISGYIWAPLPPLPSLSPGLYLPNVHIPTSC